MIPSDMEIAWKPFVPDRSLASSRLRAFLPCEYLQSQGVACEIFRTERQDAYDLVIFQKAYTRQDIELAGSLKRRGARIIFDICDNHFYDPSESDFFTEKAQRIQEMVALADWISVSTPALQTWIQNKPSWVIDDALEPFLSQRPVSEAELLSHWERRCQGRQEGEFLELVWFGNAGSHVPPSGMIDLQTLLPELEAIHQEIPVSLTVISNSLKHFNLYCSKAAFPTHYIEWAFDTFPNQLAQYDLCLIPINDNPFTRCKTSNRLMTALGLGVPVVTDFIPSYEEFRSYVRFSNFRQGILDYAQQPRDFQEPTCKGYQHVHTQYPPSRTIEQWKRLILRVMNPSGLLLKAKNPHE